MCHPFRLLKPLNFIRVYWIPNWWHLVLTVIFKEFSTEASWSPQCHHTAKKGLYNIKPQPFFSLFSAFSKDNKLWISNVPLLEQEPFVASIFLQCHRQGNLWRSASDCEIMFLHNISLWVFTQNGQLAKLLKLNKKTIVRREYKGNSNFNGEQVGSMENSALSVTKKSDLKVQDRGNSSCESHYVS